MQLGWAGRLASVRGPACTSWGTRSSCMHQVIGLPSELEGGAFCHTIRFIGGAGGSSWDSLAGLLMRCVLPGPRLGLVVGMHADFGAWQAGLAGCPASVLWLRVARTLQMAGQLLASCAQVQLPLKPWPDRTAWHSSKPTQWQSTRLGVMQGYTLVNG
jgi:hypothetical protein